ncbi:hypothetical protein SH139x_000679 [Planctomycetaceae bacterium SH139]
MRNLLSLAILFTVSTVALADHPTWPTPPVDYRFEPIPPLGNRLPYSYRARFNRPSYLGGAISHIIAPSSQEAMSWHEHVHMGSYRNHAGRIEKKYFYPKPWEVLTVGPRTSRAPAGEPMPIADPLSNVYP